MVFLWKKQKLKMLKSQITISQVWQDKLNPKGMQNKTNFSCDKCNYKVPVIELLKFNKNSKTICRFCNTTLYPKKTIAFNWAFFIGFISTVLPAEIIFEISNNTIIAFSVATTGGALAFLGIVTYTYLTTEFIS